MEIKVSTHGPFFTLGARPLVDAVHDTVQELVIEGERRVGLQLYPGHGLVTGHYKRSVHGEMTDSLHGRVHDSNVVYGPWLEGTSSRNKTTRFRGYALFRRATQQLDRLKGGVLAKHVARAIARLN